MLWTGQLLVTAVFNKSVGAEKALNKPHQGRDQKHEGGCHIKKRKQDRALQSRAVTVGLISDDC